MVYEILGVCKISHRTGKVVSNRENAIAEQVQVSPDDGARQGAGDAPSLSFIRGDAVEREITGWRREALVRQRCARKVIVFFLVGAFFSLRAPLNQAQEAGRKKSACTKAGRKPQLSPFSTTIRSALSVDFKASVSSTLRERSCYIVIKNSEGFQSFSASTACREYDCLPVMYKASGLACMPKRENAANSM